MRLDDDIALFHGHHPACPYTIEGDWLVCRCGASRPPPPPRMTLADVVTEVMELPERVGDLNHGGWSLVRRTAVLDILQSYAYAMATDELNDRSMTLNEHGRAQCICGASVLPKNWANHLLRVSEAPHAAEATGW